MRSFSEFRTSAEKSVMLATLPEWHYLASIGLKNFEESGQNLKPKTLHILGEFFVVLTFWDHRTSSSLSSFIFILQNRYVYYISTVKPNLRAVIFGYLRPRIFRNPADKDVFMFKNFTNSK